MKDKITVAEAMADYDMAQHSIKELNSMLTALQAHPQLHDLLQAEAGKYNEEKKPHEPVYSINGAINALDKYSKLLKAAVDRTEMDWPPKTK